MKVRYLGKNGKAALLLSAFIAFLSVVFTWGLFKDSIKTHDIGWMSVSGNSHSFHLVINFSFSFYSLLKINIYIVRVCLNPLDKVIPCILFVDSMSDFDSLFTLTFCPQGY